MSRYRLSVEFGTCPKVSVPKLEFLTHNFWTPIFTTFSTIFSAFQSRTVFMCVCVCLGRRQGFPSPPSQILPTHLVFAASTFSKITKGTITSHSVDC